MTNIPKTTIIIPAYNESRRPVSPLKSALKAHHVSKIIIIDDGSADDTVHHIQTYLDTEGNTLAAETGIEVIFIKHTKNLGKTEAIKSGLSQVDTPTILMLDADIKDFLPHYIDAMVEQFHLKNAGMLIYYKQSKGHPLLWLLDTLLRSELLYNGERMIKTDILQTVLEQGTQGYMLETALNMHCLDHNQTIVILKGPYFHHILKAEKGGGVIQGIRGDIRMARQILKQGGLRAYLRQRRVIGSLVRSAPSVTLDH